MLDISPAALPYSVILNHKEDYNCHSQGSVEIRCGRSEPRQQAEQIHHRDINEECSQEGSERASRRAHHSNHEILNPLYRRLQQILQPPWNPLHPPGAQITEQTNENHRHHRPSELNRHPFRPPGHSVQEIEPGGGFQGGVRIFDCCPMNTLCSDQQKATHASSLLGQSPLTTKTRGTTPTPTQKPTGLTHSLPMRK